MPRKLQSKANTSKSPQRPRMKAEKRAQKAASGVTRGPVNASELARYVVGIGASAGGLEALRTLFGQLKSVDRLCLVVVQHLAPQHRSRMVELVGHATSLEVEEVQDGMPLQPGKVLITPPNADVVLEEGRLVLRPPEGKVGPKPSIDLFLRSLADGEGENAIAVILSGTGSDGAAGIRAVKAAGGVTICQTPQTAKYDGMPRAAKQTGAVDLELPPEEIARQLTLFNDVAHKTSQETLQSALPPAHDPYRLILAMLEKQTRVDFTNYKQPTVRRRIERRMVATRCESLTEYAEYLRSHPDEPRLLFEDILISVTSFFRDQESFTELLQSVQARIETRSAGGSFRCWVVGCATGEEAYSLAIVIHEAIEKLHKPMSVQVFATDIDDRAMLQARKGIYPRSALQDVPMHLRAKYFDELPDNVKVKDFLRDMIVFARHDVTQDPPFLKMDMITCRNVLIYFGSRLQEHVLKTFHFALEDKGILFLGRSEAASAVADLFEPTEKNAKIFTRTSKKTDLPRNYSRQESNREAALLSQDRVSTSHEGLFNAMVQAFAPDSVLVDNEFRLRHIYGIANTYLNVPRGEPSTSITRLLPPEVALEAGTLLHRAARSRHTARGAQKHTFIVDHKKVSVTLCVVPLMHEGKYEYFVCFQSVPKESATRESTKEYARLPQDQRIKRLEAELAQTREHLQTITEEHETANEELQALNEELQSANEELQSTNEELETTNEELQSTNEELTTLNQEINVRSNELVALNQRLVAIQNAIFYPLLVVDPRCRLLDYNPAARYMLRVTDMDKGEHLRGLAGAPLMASVTELVEQSFKAGRDAKVQMRANERDFEIRVQVFRGSRDLVEGAVVSFVENTELVAALEASRASRTRLEGILENTPALVTMKDATGAYTYVNRRFVDVMGMPPDTVLGRTDEEVFGLEVGGALRDRDFEVLRTRAPLRVEEAIPVQGQTRYWMSSKFPLLDERQKAQSVCTVSLDATERVIERRQLETFKTVVSAAGAGIVLLEQRGDGWVTTLIGGEMNARIGPGPDISVGASLPDLLNRLLSDADPTQVPEVIARIETQPNGSFNLNLGHKSGVENWIELRTTTIDFPTEGTRYMAITLFDVNDQIRTQRMVQAQQEEVSRFSKLASLGEVAAGIAHEINTPLNVITTRTDLLRRLVDKERLDGAAVKKVAQDVDGMVQTISQVIQGLRSVSNLESEKRSAHDLSGLVREAVRICDFRLRRAGVMLHVDLPRQQVHVECFPVQVVQILINLINNAVDAVAELKERWVRIAVEQQGSMASLRVIDSGRGIDPDMAEKIMAPFFTTKRERNGTGLGLSISRNLARRHGGDLSVETAAPNTTFRLDLPMFPMAGAPVENPA